MTKFRACMPTSLGMHARIAVRSPSERACATHTATEIWASEIRASVSPPYTGPTRQRSFSRGTVETSPFSNIGNRASSFRRSRLLSPSSSFSQQKTPSCMLSLSDSCVFVDPVQIGSAAGEEGCTGGEFSPKSV